MIGDAPEDEDKKEVGGVVQDKKGKKDKQEAKALKKTKEAAEAV
jgi:hypothetical protein